jgi:hypothetical protein
VQKAQKGPFYGHFSQRGQIQGSAGGAKPGIVGAGVALAAATAASGQGAGPGDGRPIGRFGYLEVVFDAERSPTPQ